MSLSSWTTLRTPTTKIPHPQTLFATKNRNKKMRHNRHPNTVPESLPHRAHLHVRPRMNMTLHGGSDCPSNAKE
jgi:hypothetical protein